MICKIYKNYCNNGVHTSEFDCHNVMKTYYTTKYYGKIFFVCPACESIANCDYMEFYRIHQIHLTQFSRLKKTDILRRCYVNSVQKQSDKPNEIQQNDKMTMEDTIIISDDEESIYQIGGNIRGRKQMNTEPGT